MKYIISLILLIGTTQPLLASCLLEIENKYCINLEWTEGPYIDAYSTNTISVTSLATKKAINLEKEYKFFSWMIMDMHEHGSTEVLTINSENGIYENDEIYFFSGMNGDWQFRMMYNDETYILEEIE